MRSLALALACSWLLGFIRPSLTMQEAPSSAPLQLSPTGNLELESEVDPETLLQGLELQGNPGKRAYTYVSEYKRLPIYNFGLGKRWNIGGGSNTVDEDKVRFVPRFRPSRNGASCTASGACNPFFQRARLYSFGLGKRARPYSFGLGKRADDSSASTSSSSSSSSFGFRGQPDLEELSRDPLEDYLEKRSRQLYSFGLGKRMVGDERGDYGQRFNFGLGKRPSEDYGHRYKFGLGKRRLLVNDNRISASDDEEEQQQPALAS